MQTFYEDRPICTVDAVILTLEDGILKALVHRRPNEPYKGMWALPGGYIHPGEDESAEAAVSRILRDKMGLSGFYLEQLRTFSGAARDPRGWSISVTFIALVPRERLPEEDDSTCLMDVENLPALAFDHAELIGAAVSRLRGKGAYSTLPAMLLPETFTLPELEKTYGAVLAKKIDHSSFRRKLMELGLLEETDEFRQTGKRPARLYRLAENPKTVDRNLGTV